MTVVGIDLGTTISSIGVADADGVIRLARLRDGSPRLRSVVSIENDGRIVVGDEAQSLAPLQPESTFAFFKRRMGTGWSVPHDGRTWTASALSAEILRALVADAAADFGARPEAAVVTIPAYFGDDARRATFEAGQLAGIEVVELLHEPTAACLAYAPNATSPTTQLVYDLGGGTFDVSVVRFGPTETEVIATAGDDRLGGKDWDDVLVDMIADQLERQTGADVRDDLEAVTDLLERAREAKHTLSQRPKAVVRAFVDGRVQQAEVTVQEFMSLAAPLFAKTETLVEQVLNDVGGRSAIDGVLLVGGSSRMPRCREVLASVTGLEPRTGIDPDAAVAMGASLLASRHTAGRHGRQSAAGAVRIKDVTAHALGFVVVSADGSRYVNEVMIERNAPIPIASTKRHRLTVVNGQTGVLDVYMLQGEASRPLDTTPLGRWSFEDVPGGRKGDVEIDVSYEYDVDGVVQVAASVDGRSLGAPRIDRADRDLRWTDEDPSSHAMPDLAVALVIDVSGSMSGSKLDEAKAACIEFVDVLAEAGVGDRIMLVAFGSSASVAAPLGTSSHDLRDATRRLAVTGSTNLAHGLELAWNGLGSSNGRRVVIVLTDGAPDSKPAALNAREMIIHGDGEIIARGVSGADVSFLRQLDGGGELLGAGEVVNSFRGIARQLTAGGSSTGLRLRR